MEKNKPNKLPNQSFQQGCACLRYTTFDNISRRIASSGLLSAIQGYLSSFHFISAPRGNFWLRIIDLCAFYSNPLEGGNPDTSTGRCSPTPGSYLQEKMCSTLTPPHLLSLHHRLLTI